MIKKLKITVDGKAYEVTVEVEEEKVAAVPDTAPVSSRPVSAANAESAPSAPVAPAVAGTRLDAIVSPLAGRVTAINVIPGQTVKEGEHVLTLEAMKMNTFVFAQKGGKIKEIQVAVGDGVQENQPLIILE